MDDLCIECQDPVRRLQHGVTCDVCDRWQHRTCNTGITRLDYFKARKRLIILSFVCKQCKEPGDAVNPLHSTMAETSLSSTTPLPAVTFDMGNLTDSSSTSDPDVTFHMGYMSTDVSSAVHSTFDDHGADHDAMDTTSSSDDGTAADSTVHDDSDTEVIANTSVSIRVDTSFQDPRPILEESLEDAAPRESFVEDRPVQYEVLPGASQRGKDLLSDSIGYTYNIKERNRVATVWLCSVRNQTTRCPARVRQVGNGFHAGGKEHNHPPAPSNKARIVITQQATQQATQQWFTAASGIVESAANEVITTSDVEHPNIDNIVRVVNRKRQRLRPEDPKDIDFEVNEEFIADGFYRGEVRVDDRRHLIFATDEQLRLLKSAKRWYLDGTFKVVREPFDNLLSIHAFVRRGDCAKQIPLVFILMSGRRAKDYTKVLKKIGRLLDSEVIVEDFVVDYEAALWKALRHVFVGAQIHGCAFHWGQAVWRQIQAKGLATEYSERTETYSFLRKLLCLPYLPHGHITEVFEALADLAPERFQPLLTYMRSTWFRSDVWPIECWSVFGMSVRTNNDVEGWHRRLNIRAGGCPPFYLLVRLLNDEANVAIRNVQLVTELQLKRYQRKTYQTLQGKTFELWQMYKDGEITATGMLKKFSNLYKPAVH